VHTPSANEAIPCEFRSVCFARNVGRAGRTRSAPEKTAFRLRDPPCGLLHVPVQRPRPSVLVPPYYSQRNWRTQQWDMRPPSTRWIIHTYFKLTALLVLLAGAIRLLDR
jgi:hypothetical protein